MVIRVIQTSEEILECPLCSGEKFHKYEPTSYLPINIVECECGMVFQEEYLTQEEIGEFYKATYRLSVHPFKDSVSAHNIMEEEIRGKNVMAYLNDLDIVFKNCLDVGSSTGSLLKMLKSVYGCEIIGVEPGDMFRKYSNKESINTVADISEVDGKFDLVTMVHVFEHLVNNHQEMLESIWDLLEDDGYLFGEVPDMGVALAHPVMFNSETLYRMIDKTKFRIVDMYRVPQYGTYDLRVLARKKVNNESKNKRTVAHSGMPRML